MIITTTDSIEGKPAEQYLGVVTGEAVFSVGMFSEMKAGLKAEISGGRVDSFTKELEAAKDQAMVEMIKEANILEAHAVVGVDIDYLEFRDKYLLVIMSGTAVRLKGVKEAEFPENYMMPTEKPVKE